jgi:hypothetical protein
LAVLCGEPWCYTPGQAGRLTYYQIGRILYAERDDKGQLVIRPRAETLSAEERFARTWMNRGSPRWRIAELWQEELRKSAEADCGKNSAKKRRRRK